MNWHAFADPTVHGRLCMTLFHSVWQLGLLAVTAWCLDVVWRRRSVQWSYALHVAALIVGIAALALSLGADVLGVGGNSSVFGPKQIAGTIGGIAMAFVGLFLVLKSNPAESLAS